MKIIIFITQIIIFRNIRPKNLGSEGMTQTKWILMKDPSPLGLDA
jgi:hypothetical protein